MEGGGRLRAQKPGGSEGRILALEEQTLRKAGVVAGSRIFLEPGAPPEVETELCLKFELGLEGRKVMRSLRELEQAKKVSLGEQATGAPDADSSGLNQWELIVSKAVRNSMKARCEGHGHDPFLSLCIYSST